VIAFSRVGWGWLVLGVVLLVPLFSFWQWWQGLNTRRSNAQLSKTPPSAFGGTVSPASAPMAPGSPSPAAPAAPNNATSTKSPDPSPASGAPPGEKAGGRGQKTPGATGAVAAPAGSASAASGQASGSLASLSGMPNPLKADLPGYAPKLDRDPTLSPPDIKRLLEREQRGQKGPVVKDRPIQSRIQLTGIIQTPRGINAIVNNERVRKGDDVLGARIVRISPSCVDFEYHKQTFKKCIIQ